MFLYIQVRVSAVLTNGSYLLNVDCDHYINNRKALREGMCFLMDPNVGPSVCYVQFPQRFDGIDRNDRYSNHYTVFFYVSITLLHFIYYQILIFYGIAGSVTFMTFCSNKSTAWFV